MACRMSMASSLWHERLGASRRRRRRVVVRRGTRSAPLLIGEADRRTVPAKQSSRGVAVVTGCVACGGEWMAWKAVAGFAPEPGGEGAAANDERVSKKKNGSAAACSANRRGRPRNRRELWRCRMAVSGWRADDGGAALASNALGLATRRRRCCVLLLLLLLLLRAACAAGLMAPAG